LLREEWIERWQEGRIGWHEPAGNASLKKYWRANGRRVLVPMCGKTPDLKWLADQGNEVVGVELSELAIKAFFYEQKLEYSVTDDELPAYHTIDRSITIYCGDYFRLTSVRCDAHYDRGALIAMPGEIRPSYAAHTTSLLQSSAEQLVITLEYDQSRTPGPPFSVPAEEVLAYWPDLVCINKRDDLENGPPKFRDAGLKEMIETIWRSS
jgi:thiopurine S-methyltransferase